MNRLLQKITGLPKNHLLSGLIGMLSGSSAIATAIKYMLIGSEDGSISIPRKLTWAELTSLSIVLGVGGLLVVLGSILILRRKNKSGAVLVLVPGVFYSFFAKPYGLPYLIALVINYQGYGVHLEEYILGLLAGFALPITSAILTMQKLPAKKEIVALQRVADVEKRGYVIVSAALGLISGLSALLVGVIMAFNPARYWPLSVAALFLVPDGILMILGSYFVLKRKPVLGALLVLIPGMIYGSVGLPMLFGIIRCSFTFSITDYIVGLALPIASCILAFYTKS